MRRTILGRMTEYLEIEEMLLKIQSTNFNLKHIAESGQCFRMKEIGDGNYSVIAFGEYAELQQTGDDSVIITKSTNNNTSLWRNYFDLDYDYEGILAGLLKGDDEFLRKAAAFGRGLRILRQEPFEALISFIISQNKNIPAIRNSIEKLCRSYGEEKQIPAGSTSCQGAYHTFPTAESLAAAGKDALRTAGLGYRDEYVYEAAKAAAEGRLDLERLKLMECDALMKELMSIKGVGKKVASCVALFGFHQMAAVPVDVWIERVNREIYGGGIQWEKFGHIAGLVQQYMFYYMRSGAEITAEV